jgi:hypothetical protein
MMGWDDPNFDFENFSKLLEAMYGVDLTYDYVDEEVAMEFLSRKVVSASDHARDYESLRRATPDFAVIQDPKTIMMRRSGMTARLAAAPGEQHLRGRIMRTVGHSQLAAHQRELFDTLARDYLEDAALLLNQNELPADITTDADGMITDVKWKQPPDDANPTFKNRLNWLRKAGNLLSYDDLIRAHIAGSEVSKAEPRSKRKIAGLRFTDGKMVLAMRAIDATGEMLKLMCPTYIYRMWADNNAPPIYEPNHTGDFRVERWIHAMLKAELGERPDDKDLEDSFRMSPFSGTLDPPGFLDWRETEEGQLLTLSDTPEKTGGHVILIMGIYIIMNVYMTTLGRRNLAGMLIRTYFFFNTDMAKLYATANLAYYLGTARSSIHISALVPRDPYHGPKKMAVMLAGMLPHWVGEAVPWSFIVSWWPSLVELMARYTLARSQARVTRMALIKTYPAAWDKAAAEVTAHFSSNLPYGYLSAPTSAGKSTMFLTAMARLSNRQLILVVPTKLLRNEYYNPWADYTTLILEDGGVYTYAPRLVVMTYGQFLARRKKIIDNKPVIFLDETHMGQPEMIETVRLLKRANKIMLSATERKDIFPDAGPSYYPEVKRRGKLKLIPARGTTETLVSRGLGMLKEGERLAIMVVGVKEAENLAAALTKGGHPAYPVTAKRRQVLPVGHLVGTAIMHTGLNIEPPPTVLVSSGRELAVVRGEKSTQWTCPSTHIQQAGRGGRRGEAVFLFPPQVGTGPPPLPYPSWNLFTSSAASKTNFEKVYGIVINLKETEGEAIGAGADTTTIGQATTADKNTLWHLYKFLVCTDSVGQAVRAYVVWRNGGVFMIGFEQARDSIQAVKRPPPTDLASHSLLQILDGKPFLTNINGKDIYHRGLMLKGNTATSL